MKKSLVVLTLAAAALLIAGCDENRNGTTETGATLTEIGIYADENPNFLKEDIVIENPSVGTVTLTFPAGVITDSLKAVTVRFGVSTESAVIVVNDVEYEPDFVGSSSDAVSTVAADSTATTDSTKAATVLDLSDDLDIFVKDGNLYTVYSISVKVNSSLSFTQVAINQRDSTTATPFFAINPVTDEPTIASILNSSEGYYPFVYKYNGSDFVSIDGGESGIIYEKRANNIGLGFDDTGAIWAGFRDYTDGTSASLAKTSVLKLGSSGHSFMGSQNFAVYPRSSYAVLGNSASDMWLAYSCGAADNGISSRCLELCHWTGSDWTVAQAISGRDASHYAYYCKTVYGRDGNKYLFVYNQNAHSVSLYQLTSSGFTTVFENLQALKSSGEVCDMMNLRDVECAVDKEGIPYILVSCQFVTETYNPAVIKITTDDSGNLVQSILGGVFTDRDIDSDGSDNYGFAVTDDGTPYFAYTASDDNLYYTFIESASKTWSFPILIATDTENPTLAFSKDGTAYIAALNGSGRICLFKAEAE